MIPQDLACFLFFDISKDKEVRNQLNHCRVNCEGEGSRSEVKKHFQDLEARGC